MANEFGWRCNISFPPFTTTTKLADKTETSTQQVVRSFNSLITNLQTIFTALLNKVQLDSVLLQNVVLQPGLNTINHTLGRTLTGVEVVLRSAVFQHYETNITINNFQMYSDVAVTVSLLVF